MASQRDQYELEVFDSNSMDWLDIPIEQIGSSLPLKLFTADTDTGMSCALCVTTPGSSIRGIPTAARTACLC
jgi:hypothetical protein